MQYEEQHQIASNEAYRRYRNGEAPSFSTGICEFLTAGYGHLDAYGYYEFPLNVDNETFEILD